MLTRNHLILMLASFALLVAACQQAPVECSRLNASEQTECIVSAAAAQRQPGFCSSLKDEKLNAYCLTEVAGATNETGPCEAIADPRTREFCKRDILVQRGDAATCAQLVYAPARDDCYDSYARSGAQWRTCLNISAGEYRETCILDNSHKAGDVQGCLALPRGSEERDPCIFQLSLKARNSDTCLEIANRESRSFCIINVAVALNDTTICEKITDASKGLCTSLVGQQANETFPARPATLSNATSP